MNKIFTVLLVILNMGTIALAEIRLTNVKCEELDPPFATFEKCELKMVKRGVVVLNIYSKLHQIPITNVSLNLAIFKKSNGYRPYVYNVTTDFCWFMKNMKRNPLLNSFMEIVSRDSNINHTCPYDHDIIVQNLIVREDTFNIIPMLPGDYMFKFRLGAYNDWKADVNVYVSYNSLRI